MIIANYKEALKYYIHSIRLFDKLIKGSKSPLLYYYYGELTNSIGIIYKKLENYNESINYYKKYQSVLL